MSFSSGRSLSYLPSEIHPPSVTTYESPLLVMKTDTNLSLVVAIGVTTSIAVPLILIFQRESKSLFMMLNIVSIYNSFKHHIYYFSDANIRCFFLNGKCF